MAGIELIISSICNATFCDNVYDNPLYDLQQTQAQIELTALKDELNGKHLKIATYYNYPLSWTEVGENGTLIGRGVAFVIVDILREKFNFSFEVVIPDQNYEVGGSKPEDSLIGLVNSSMVDMAAAFIPTLARFRKKVLFSTNLDEGVWMMMLRRPKESATGSGLLAPFKERVWYLILAAVLSYGPCITLLTRIRSKLVNDVERHITLSPSFWFVYGAFIKQGTTLSPDANTTRVLFATWWMFIILLSAFYTANLTAFLTLSKFTLDIEYAQDLYKKNYRWVAAEGSAVQFILKNSNDDLYLLSRMVANGRAEFRSFTTDSDYLPMVIGGAVLVKEQTSIDHLMYGDYLRKAREGIAEGDRCTYVVAPHAFIKKIRAFAYPSNSPLKKLFDTVITYLLQAGIVNFLEHRDLPSTKICPLDLQSKDRQLRNSDLMMTYIIMVVGLAAAAVTFVVEITFKRYFHIKVRESMKKKKKVKLNKKTKEQSYEDSRPPPYESLFGNNRTYDNTGKSEKKIINGTEYWIVNTRTGDKRLIPVRTPSASLFQWDK